MTSQITQNQSSPLSSTQTWQGPHILALVIGINKYTSPTHSCLQGAVADANIFEQFLREGLKVSDANIINLRDEQASRASILSAFTSLRDDKKYKKDDAAIIIFYAGHGARTKIPQNWEREGWNTSSGHIELLCPSDIGCPILAANGEESKDIVQGIPDRTISFLLNQISDAKGNNITLILDCCHSAGINRAVDSDESEQYMVRRISKLPQFEDSTDRALFKSSDGSGARKSTIADGFSGKFNASHVLLAACGREQVAREDSKQGIFTSRLMQVFRDDDINKLTYTSLIHKMNAKMPKEQTPHCEGQEVNRLLFNRVLPVVDRSFILAKREGNSEKISVILQAGKAQGITEGSRMGVYAYNFLGANPRLGYLTVKKVKPYDSVLSDAETVSLPAALFYCLNEDPAQKIALYCADRDWLKTIVPPQKHEGLVITIVDDVESCDLQLTVLGGKVHFDRYHKLVTPHLGARICHTVDFDNKTAIQKVMKSSSHFYHHLTRTGDVFPDVRMELTKLKEERQIIGLDRVFTPIGENLIEKDPATIIVDNAYVGMRIVNETPQSLYPSLFYFDPTDLTIVSWYSSPQGAGPGEVDAPLPPKSTLTLGFGDGGVSPWQFSLRDGDKKDIGFFKLFLSTSPTDFSSMLQESPFDNMGRAAGPAPLAPPKLWATKSVTVIQVDS